MKLSLIHILTISDPELTEFLAPGIILLSWHSLPLVASAVAKLPWFLQILQQTRCMVLTWHKSLIARRDRGMDVLKLM
jgi:hypothetical protein